MSNEEYRGLVSPFGSGKRIETDTISNIVADKLKNTWPSELP